MAVPSVFTVDFWRREANLLWESIDELVMLALLAGHKGGMELLPLQIRPLIDFDFVNRAAIRYLREYRLDLIEKINGTTRREAMNAIEDWLKSEEPLESLRRKLGPLFGKTRADRIAQTETTRVVAAGNQQLWESTGFVSAKVFQTANDDKVCVLCGPLHGQIVELTSEFKLLAEQVANSPQMKALGFTGVEALERATKAITSAGATHLHPPIHVGCRCWIQPQVSTELLREQRRKELGLD